MRYPHPYEVEAVMRVRGILSRLGADLRSVQPRLLWAPTVGTYVVAVPYDSRLQYRLPDHVAANGSPYSPQSPHTVRMMPYAHAVPVVMVTMPPAAMNPKNANIIMGKPRESLRYGTGFGFPAVSVGPAPVIDGVAYNTEDPQYCMATNTPALQPTRSLYFPVQPRCQSCSAQTP